MKTIPRFNHCTIRSCLAFALLIASAGFAPRLYSADSAAPAAEETKTHTLFMGADIAIERNKEFFNVSNVVGDSFVIKIKGQDVLVPMGGGPINLKVDHSLKLTEKSASIANLKGERAFTPGNEPSRKLAQAFVDATAMNAVWQSSVNDAAVLRATVENEASSYRPDPLNPVANTSVSENLRLVAKHYNTAVAGPGSTTQLVGIGGEEDMFDAMEVAFEVSADKPLNQPYVVVIAKYREADSKPGAFRNWIYARALDPIGREGKKVHFKQGGFPSGFQLESYQVHLYNGKEEIATSVSSKRVELTREEAFEYVMIEYVGAHKGATLPAVPAMGRLPADLSGRLAGGEFNQPFYVRVSDNGQPVAAYLDESCTQKVADPYLESVVKSIRFKPALAKGRPVEGIARLKLNELTM